MTEKFEDIDLSSQKLLLIRNINDLANLEELRPRMKKYSPRSHLYF